MNIRVRVAIALACLGLAGPLAAQTITEFPIPTTRGYGGIAVGSDGNLWWTERDANSIGRITPAGLVTRFRIASFGKYETWGIAAGPDGNLWFTATKPREIGRITPAGVITRFRLPDSGGRPVGIAAGPDGNLWFTEGGLIGRITTTGVVTEFPTATYGSWGIAAGPDGNLWFTDPSDGLIGRITTTGVVTEFSIGAVNSKPWGIAAGPDGNLWFTELDGNKIGRITTAGVVAEFAIPTAHSPSSIAAGPDGNLWFTQNSANTIGRITTTGVITEFPIPTAHLDSGGITAGEDGSLWFAEWSAIGRITTSPCSSATKTPCMDTGEGSLDISSGTAGQTRVLLRDADRLSVRTLDASGLWTSTSFEGPFPGWYAAAIADGRDGHSRVLWRNRDGRVSLESLGPDGNLASIRFAAEHGWTAIDVSAGFDGSTHLLQTSEDGKMRLTSVLSSGASTDGPTYGPYDGWSARALDDGPDGATWVLWRHNDGGTGLVRYREGAVEKSFRWAANPEWGPEDLAVRDGVPRVLWTNPDGRMGISSVDPQGQLFDRKVYSSIDQPARSISLVRQQARRIASSPDGTTRVLWRGPYGTGSLWILNPDNSIESQRPSPGFETGGPAFGDWAGTYQPAEGFECSPGSAEAHLWQYGSIVLGTLSSSSDCGFTVRFQGTLEGPSLSGSFSGFRFFSEGGTAQGTLSDTTLELSLGVSPIPSGVARGQVSLRRLPAAGEENSDEHRP